MVKDRMFALNTDKLLPIHTRAYTAYGHGAGDRMRTLASR